MRWLIGALLLVTTSHVAFAEPEPWKQGVTPAQMAAAQALLEDGNALFLERSIAEAVVKYQQALAEWNHPAIHFNLVRAFILLDRTVEAYDHLELAMRYGAAPLDVTVYNEALSYQKLLANQIATLAVTCSQPEVVVTLDGQPLAGCPGTLERRVAPGHHQIVATRPGFLTRTVEIVVLGGKRERVALEFEPLSSAGTLVHRWRGWVPWAVLGAGVLTAGAGGAIQSLAISDRDQYYAQLDTCGLAGCSSGEYSSTLKDRAIIENRIAIGLLAVGGAAAVVGGVMVYLNRGRIVYPENASGVRTSIAALPGGAALAVSGRF
jgi:hypothetical protein